MVSHDPLTPGGRRAFALRDVLLVAVVVTAALGAVLVLGPSTSERDEKTAWLEAEVRQAFGEDLESVEIRSFRTGIRDVTYRSAFSLEGVPLKFELSPTHDELGFMD
jgi:hypothetical protein